MRQRTKYLIVGGGLSGLTMAYVLTAMNEDYIIIEQSGRITEPRIHYIHEDLRGLLPFPLREVDIATNIYWDGRLFLQPTIDMMNFFSFVTTGTIFQNSMKLLDGRLKKGYVSVHNSPINEQLMPFIGRKPVVATKLERIVDGTALTENISDRRTDEIEFDFIISTIPLPFIMAAADEESDVAFVRSPLKTTEVKLMKKEFDDLYQVIYIPKADFGYARISILGDRIVAEKANGNFEATEGVNRLGLKKLVSMMLPNANVNDGVVFEDIDNPFGRYNPIDESERQNILVALRKKGIICLGRYAEWTYRRFDHVVKLAKKIAETNRIGKGEST